MLKTMSKEEKIGYINEKINILTLKKDSMNNYNLPKKLYKYMTVNENTIDALINQYIWCGCTNKLNDPYECKVNVSKSEIELFMNKANPHNQDLLNKLSKYERKIVTKKLGENFDKARKIATQFINNNKDSVKLASLSETNDNILMWSHYAANHSGICVEYLMSEIINATSCIFPVIYSECMIGISQLYPRADIGIIKQFTTKAHIWSYEREWRIISPNETNNYLDSSEMGIKLKIKPNKIYLGMNISSENEKMINLKIPVSTKKVKADDCMYSLKL